MKETLELPAVIAEVEEPLPAPPVAVDANAAALADMDRRIRDLEAALGDLRSVSAAAREAKAVTSGRKTWSAHTSAVLAKGGPSAGEQAAGLDRALGSLSIEQRFAVKAGMLQAGLL